MMIAGATTNASAHATSGESRSQPARPGALRGPAGRAPAARPIASCRTRLLRALRLQVGDQLVDVGGDRAWIAEGRELRVARRIARGVLLLVLGEQLPRFEVRVRVGELGRDLP